MTFVCDRTLGVLSNATTCSVLCLEGISIKCDKFRRRLMGEFGDKAASHHKGSIYRGGMSEEAIMRKYEVAPRYSVRVD
jgi:hypothetical protein